MAIPMQSSNFLPIIFDRQTKAMKLVLGTRLIQENEYHRDHFLLSRRSKKHIEFKKFLIDVSKSYIACDTLTLKSTSM